ncbi:hypothetical protein [Lutispora thermophila]|nr:hypothetical protein [Lutispora thermophila]
MESELKILQNVKSKEKLAKNVVVKMEIGYNANKDKYKIESLTKA